MQINILSLAKGGTFLKRIFFLSFVLGTLLILNLVGCGNDNKQAIQDEMIPTEYRTVNTLEGLDTSAKENSITPTSIVVLFDNQTNHTLLIGEAFTLEMKKANNWYQVPVVIEEEYGFNDIGYDVPINQVTAWTMDWEWLYGELDPGKYRIVQEVLDVNEPGDFEKYWIATEFVIP